MSKPIVSVRLDDQRTRPDLGAFPPLVLRCSSGLSPAPGLLFLTRPLELLPEAALAAIIFRIGFDLVDIQGMRPRMCA